MPRGYGRKLSTVVFILIFTLLLLNSFAFAEGLVNKGLLTNYSTFGKSLWAFVIPKAYEYYDADNDYSIIIEKGIPESIAKVIQESVNNLPEALIPSGAKIVIAYEKTAGDEHRGSEEGATMDNDIFIKAEKMTICTIIHETAHYLDDRTKKSEYSDSDEYFEALNNDWDINGGYYASMYAGRYIKENKYYRYREQFAELTSFIYNGVSDTESNADQSPVEAITNNPNQAKYIIETVMKGEEPILPDGVNYKELIEKGLKGSSANSSNNDKNEISGSVSINSTATAEVQVGSSDNAHAKKDLNSESINTNGISSYLSENSLDSDTVDSNNTNDEDDGDDADSDYYMDEENGDDADSEYYEEEESDDDADCDYYYDEEEISDDSDDTYYFDEENGDNLDSENNYDEEESDESETGGYSDNSLED